MRKHLTYLAGIVSLTVLCFQIFQLVNEAHLGDQAIMAEQRAEDAMQEMRIYRLGYLSGQNRVMRDMLERSASLPRDP